MIADHRQPATAIGSARVAIKPIDLGGEDEIGLAQTTDLVGPERHLGLAVGTSISGDVKAWRTPLTLWQSAGVVAVYVASGLSYAWITGHTGLEARLIDKMLDACTGLSPEKSNELVQKIMRKVDELLPTVQKQVPFPEAYDLNTVQPKPEYEAGLMRVMDELARLGMPLK